MGPAAAPQAVTTARRPLASARPAPPTSRARAPTRTGPGSPVSPARGGCEPGAAASHPARAAHAEPVPEGRAGPGRRGRVQRGPAARSGTRAVDAARPRRPSARGAGPGTAAGPRSCGTASAARPPAPAARPQFPRGPGRAGGVAGRAAGRVPVEGDGALFSLALPVGAVHGRAADHHRGLGPGRRQAPASPPAARPAPRECGDTAGTWAGRAVRQDGGALRRPAAIGGRRRVAGPARPCGNTRARPVVRLNGHARPHPKTASKPRF